MLEQELINITKYVWGFATCDVMLLFYLMGIIAYVAKKINNGDWTYKGNNRFIKWWMDKDSQKLEEAKENVNEYRINAI